MTPEAVPLRIHHIPPLQGYRNNPEGWILGYNQDLTILSDPGRSPYLERIYAPYSDSVGSPRNQVNHVACLTTSLNRYLALPDKTTLKLIVHGNDWICDAHFKRNHCREHDPKISPESKSADTIEKFMHEYNIVGPFERHGDPDNLNFFVITAMSVIHSLIRIDKKLGYYIG